MSKGDFPVLDEDPGVLLPIAGVVGRRVEEGVYVEVEDFVGSGPYS